jgi:sulfotransferase famil protein
MRRRELVVYVHIQKTAGTTLAKVFESNYGRRAINLRPPLLVDAGRASVLECINRHVLERGDRNSACLYGHLAYYGVHWLLGGATKPLYLTFLRDPVERVISLYYFLKSSPELYWSGEINENGWSLADWFQKSQLAGGRFDGQTAHLNWGYAVVWGYHFRATAVRGGGDVTRHASPSHVHVGEEHLEAAKELLSRFWYVGLTETFDEDLDFLYGRLGFRKVPAQKVFNATRRKEPVSAAVREMIAERNRFDLALYDHARSLRRRFIEDPVNRFHEMQERGGRLRGRSAVPHAPGGEAARVGS